MNEAGVVFTQLNNAIKIVSHISFRRNDNGFSTQDLQRISRRDFLAFRDQTEKNGQRLSSECHEGENRIYLYKRTRKNKDENLQE